MPTFRITGRGRKTGRKRAGVYRAIDQATALSMAEANETKVTEILRLPDPPASPAQVEYARSLGLTFPTDVTRSDLVLSWSARYHTELLQEGQHVEVVSAVLDLAALEVQHPACARRLLLSRGWNRAAWPLQHGTAKLVQFLLAVETATTLDRRLSTPAHASCGVRRSPSRRSPLPYSLGCLFYSVLMAPAGSSLFW